MPAFFRETGVFTFTHDAEVSSFIQAGRVSTDLATKQETWVAAVHFELMDRRTR